jgi:subtilisin family serine protease
MKAHGIVPLLLGAACAVLPARVSAQTVGADVYSTLQASERARVIVALREPGDGGLAERSAAVAAMQRSVARDVDASQLRITQAYAAIPALSGEITAAGLSSLLGNPSVVRIDLDPEIHAALAQSVPLIHADEVHDMGFTGRNVVVAVLDSGIEEKHRDFNGRLLAEECFCTAASGAGCCPNGTTRQSGAGSAPDDNGHGTNVAGIIAGVGAVAPKGVAPSAKLLDVKVLGGDGSGSFSGILAALDFILTSRPDVKVVNVSIESTLFGGVCDTAASFTQSFASAANSLKARGTIIFASSGNNASTSQVAAPACVSSVVSVGAVYKGNVGAVSFGCSDPTTSVDQVACFSNSGTKVDVVAPGAAITAAGRGGGTSTYLGTSQACPMAAGVAALLLEAKPALTPDQIARALESSGTPVTDRKNGRTFPRINAKAALGVAGRSQDSVPGPH